MRVSGFMVPAKNVVTATPNDTVGEVMDKMQQHKVGAVVIVNMDVNKCNECNDEGEGPVAVGIITNTDLLRAYRASISIDEPCKKVMGTRRLVSCFPSHDRDAVAAIIEENRTHHVIVVDEKQSNFVGLVSSYDIAAECAKDERAWPYFRDERGNIPFPVKIHKEVVPLPLPHDFQKPTTILNHKHDKGTTFMDDLDLEAFQ